MDFFKKVYKDGDVEINKIAFFEENVYKRLVFLIHKNGNTIN
jgi:hypothetical protein